MKVAIYTAIFGDYDNLIDPLHADLIQEQADLFCFSDNKNLKSDFFQVCYIKPKYTDPVRNARYCKVNSHLLLPEYDITVWVDANMKIIILDILSWINLNLNDRMIAILQHPSRKCVYEEASWASKSGVDRPDIIHRQMKRYRNVGFPINFGLVASNIIIRKNKEEKVKIFNQAWWNELKGGSRRDQLSFDYVRWNLQLEINYIIGKWDDNQFGKRMSHKKSRNYIKQQFSLKSIVPLIIKKYLKYLFSQNYREAYKRKMEYKRVWEQKTGSYVKTNFMGSYIEAPDVSSFRFMHNEIFKDKIYEFIPSSDTPYIIDGGANIGLASIFFASNYPKAEIISFEADPYIADICQQNLKSFNCQNVNLIRKALWNEKTTLSFHSEGTDAGRLCDDETNCIKVETVLLSSYLTKKVDFLKLDIEGAEVKVLEEIKDKLYLVDNLFVEYHSFVEKEQELEKVLKMIKGDGFRYILSTPSIKNKTPLKSKIEFLGMDFFVNIFATRN